MNILVTGGAGFIGSAVAKRLINEGHNVVVIDNFNEYYDVSLKRARVKALIPEAPVFEIDITNKKDLLELAKTYSFDVVCHLAAQAGVRYSVEAPEVYVETNILGTQTIFEVMKECGIKRMVFASTSSTYGMSTPVPFKEAASADRPVSIYAATKRAAEMIAYNYYIQCGIETTCLRFFTVYGPWSRPDMAMIKFADCMLAGRPIELFNDGNLKRDFTHIDDIVDGFVKAVFIPLGYEIINLGKGQPVELMNMVDLMEKYMGIVAEKKFLPMQTGDVYETYADTTKASRLLGYAPQVTLEEGMKSFVRWYSRQNNLS